MFHSGLQQTFMCVIRLVEAGTASFHAAFTETEQEQLVEIK